MHPSFVHSIQPLHFYGSLKFYDLHTHTHTCEHKHFFPFFVLCFCLRVPGLPALTFIEWTYCYIDPHLWGEERTWC